MLLVTAHVWSLVNLFLHQQADFERAISQKFNISQHGVQCVLKISVESEGQKRK